MSLPVDDNILLSLVNCALRDGEDLEGFCAKYQADCEELKARLLRAGFYYDEDKNTFKR